VFFNLFSEAEPFAAILIAHETHVLIGGGLLRPEGPKFKAACREQGVGFGGGDSEPHQLGDLRSAPQIFISIRHTKRYILDLLGAQKTHIVAGNVGHSLIFLLSSGGPAEPLDTTGGTHRFRGTPVEKH